MMKLSKLLQNNALDHDVEITGITADSRAVGPGFLFAALPGTQVDGGDYIPVALAAGAQVILCRPDAVRQDMVEQHPGVIWVREDIPAQVFAHMAARYCDRQPATVAAVTGTNGKTSVAAFTRQIWEHMGVQSGSVGTLGIQGPGISRETGMTTPDPMTLHTAMRDLCDAGVDHVVFEASSHGLAQYRLDGMNVSVAAFTNLTRDHFDYHGTQEKYFFAKARLFGEVMKPGSVAVLNADCPLVMEVADLCWARGHKVITIGQHNGDIRLLRQQTSEVGQDITIGHMGELYDVTLPLVGSFQAMNALMAVGLVIGSGGDVKQAFSALSHLRAVEGRMEQAGRHKSGARIYVDYAHTPDALETVLTAMRPHVKNKLSLVFGCGGDRDKGKRRLMGEVAQNFADRVYVTDDNPRSESAADIRADVTAGCPGGQNIEGRSAAIERAILDLESGDILLVAGKGHEQGQVVGDQILPFDDMSEIRSVLAALPSSPSPKRRHGT